MCTVPERPRGAITTNPSAARPIRPAVRFDDRNDTRTWLAAVRESVDELRAAADDATRPYSARVLSRPEARRRIVEAGDELSRLLDAADRGVDREGGAP